MQISEMNEQDCLQFLETRHLGRLGCCRDNHPYVVPVHYAIEGALIYGFSMPGQKTEWLAANPNACIQVDDLKGQGSWHSVLVEGHYTALPDTPGFHNERIHAWELLKRREMWWEPGSSKIEHLGSGIDASPVFFSISADRVTGRQALPET